jgi:hypothetical protein
MFVLASFSIILDLVPNDINIESVLTNSMSALLSLARESLTEDDKTIELFSNWDREEKKNEEN